MCVSSNTGPNVYKWHMCWVLVGVIKVRNVIMKKIVLGLALCLGLSQVVVAEKTAVRGLSDDAKT